MDDDTKKKVKRHLEAIQEHLDALEVLAGCRRGSSEALSGGTGNGPPTGGGDEGGG